MSPSELNFLLSTRTFVSAQLTYALFRNHLQVRHAQQGETIFQQGVVESNWYLIREQVRVERTSPTGVSSMCDMSVGEAFGEMGILERAPRLATTRAIEPTVLYVLNHLSFNPC